MTEPRFITLDQLVAIDDLPTEVLVVPEWDGLAVRIQGLTKAQEMEIRKAAMASGEWDADAWELGMVVQAVTEPNLTPEHVALIRGKSAGVVDRILKRVLALSGLGKGVADAAKAEFPAASGDDVRVASGEGSQDDARIVGPDDERARAGEVGGLLLGGGGADEDGPEAG